MHLSFEQTGEAKTEEQLAVIAEKRKEAGRRLQDLAVKNRAEKVHPQPRVRRERHTN